MLQRVHDNGHTYKGIYEGWYCPRCADFKVENEILEGNRCPIHEIVLERHSEENWFFRLSTFQEPLERLYAEHPDFVMPPHHFNEARSFIASGLQDISLSRARLKWGVQVPWDPSHVFYVWFDALLNYYTALSYARPGEDLTDRFWPATYHLIGKDILKFHTVFWPAMLMAADLPVPEHVFVHGFLLGSDGRKMSKSLGNVLDPFEAMDEFGTDALRFYLMRDVPFGGDGAVGMAAVKTRYETELANEYGNLASRTIAMVLRYRDGAVPGVATDPALRSEFDGLAERVAELLDGAEATQALEQIWQRVRRCNRYVEEQAPWQLARDPDARQAARPDAGVADRGRAGAQRAAAPVHAREHGAPARRDRLWRPGLRRRAVRRAARDRRGDRARSRCSRSADGRDRQPHAPRLLRAAERRAGRARARRPGSRGWSPSGRPARPAGRRSRRPRTSLRCTPRSAATRTRPPDSTTPTSPSSRLSPPTPSAWRSARPAWTSTATTRPARIRSGRSRLRSSSRATPASRS